MISRRFVLFSLILVIIIIFAADFYLYSKKPHLLSRLETCPNDFHYSYFSTKSFFDDAYRNAPSAPTQTTNIKGVIVNHHLFAANLIAQTFNIIATSTPITVVLISPNHFSTGHGQIISSLYNWETPYGVLNSDCELISEIAIASALNIDESPFEKEHGISGIVSFIKRSLPNAKIIPIIVKETVSENDLNNFVNSLYISTGENVLIIGSFDFAHKVSGATAVVQDEKSISVIKNFDYNGLTTIDVDSRRGLEIVMKYMEKEGATNFSLIANANSSQIVGDSNLKEVTSYITGTFSVIK